jgi:glycosyltransferase involved in cell wall biosynthesis
MPEIWFWQRIISPHMAGLAIALARRGCKVTYVAEQAMSADRTKQGWAVPVLADVNLIYIESRLAVTSLVFSAPGDAVHICQGIRANGLVAYTQRLLASRGFQSWVVMETVNDAVWFGALKRAEYSRLFHKYAASLQGVLACGHRTVHWVAERGLPHTMVFPFAYFLPDNNLSATLQQRKPGPFRFVFAGQLIPRKRVDWLINSLASLTDRAFELCIVGTGPVEPALRALAAQSLGRPVTWLGQLPLNEVPAVMAQADCLVLPSVHDGWGAVASEALMTGTPVICSDACGVAGVVQASGVGGVFPVKDKLALGQLLTEQLARGPVSSTKRCQIADWARCLGAAAGARYLHEILIFNNANTGARPEAPWLREKFLCVDS